MVDHQATSLRALGHLEPVTDEIVATNLEVSGALPPQLNGRYLRNGPNRSPDEDTAHWFLGHGMLHGVSLRDGRADWYRNRWVRTTLWQHATNSTELAGTPADNPSNTHIIEHSGVLLSLCEGGFPYRVTDELETVGPYDFDKRLRTTMTAHPKEDPHTNELFFYGSSPMEPPHLTFHIASKSGELVHSEAVDIPKPTMMHDFAITENYVLWLDLPVVFDRTKVDTMPFTWDDDHGARIGIMSRGGGHVKWIEIDPCFIFHVGNAYERDGKIQLEVVRYGPESFIPMWHGMEDLSDMATAVMATSHLYRLTIDPQRETVHEAQLAEDSLEFPIVHDDRVGYENRYLYAVDGGRLFKFDQITGVKTIHDFGVDMEVGEASFVPDDAATYEDDGWLLTIVTPTNGGTSSLAVLDASAVANAPVATVSLPSRVPTGFHGSWIADEH